MDNAALILASSEAYNNRVVLSKKIFSSLVRLIIQNGAAILGREHYALTEGVNIFPVDKLTEYDGWEIEFAGPPIS